MGYDFVFEIEGESGTRSCSATGDEVPSALQSPFLAYRIATITNPALSPFPSTRPCPLNVTPSTNSGNPPPYHRNWLGGIILNGQTTVCSIPEIDIYFKAKLSLNTQVQGL
jgi:hypothetical protein